MSERGKIRLISMEPMEKGVFTIKIGEGKIVFKPDGTLTITDLTPDVAAKGFINLLRERWNTICTTKDGTE